MRCADGEAGLRYSQYSRKEASAHPLGNSGLAGLTGLCTPTSARRWMWLSGGGRGLGKDCSVWLRLFPKREEALLHQQPTFLAD